MTITVTVDSGLRNADWLHRTTAKVFDPVEARDDDGKWTAESPEDKQHREARERLGMPPMSRYATYGEDAAYDWGEKNFTEWAKGLNKPQREALVQFKKANYGLNKALREHDVGLINRFSDLINSCNQALKKGTLPNAVQTYRHADTAVLKELGGNVGKIVSDPGFLSTTVVVPERLALRLAGQPTDNLDSTGYIIIRAPKGVHAAYVDVQELTGPHHNENELAFPRGTRLRVDQYDADKNIAYVTVLG